MSAPRKPAGTNGMPLPELMEQLGVTSWTNVPNPILERWMGADNPPRLRVMAALVRHSFGYQSAYAVQVVKGKRQPLHQAELARMLGIQQRWLKKVLGEIKSQGLVKADGKLLYPVATPPKMGSKLNPPAFSSPFSFSSPSGGPSEAQGKNPDDPEYREEVAQIKRDYLREIGEAKGRMIARLEVARARAVQRRMGFNLDPILGFDLDPKTGHSEKRKEKKEEEAGGQAARVETDDSSSPPAFPSLEVEELHRYLEQLAYLVGTAPDPAETAEIHARLKTASIGQFRTHVENRLKRGLRPQSWRIFHRLASDCASGRMAPAPPAAEASGSGGRQARLLRLQRALGVEK